MPTQRPKEKKRAHHSNRRRGRYRLVHQRYMHPLFLLAALGALFVHLGALRVFPHLYRLWNKHFAVATPPERVENEETVRVVVTRERPEDNREAAEQELPTEPMEPEEIAHEPEEIDILDMDMQELIMAPGETNLPLPTPEDDAQQKAPEAEDFMPPAALDFAQMGDSALPDQAELIPEPTPLNSNSVIAHASPKSDALENAEGLIESELRKQAKDGNGGLSGEVRSLKDLMGVRNPGASSGVARLKTDVLFAFNQSKLKNEARIPLLQLAALIHKNPQTRFIIEGHTDSIGSEEYNALLSLLRAAAVCHWLTGNGVPTKNVYMRACGSSRPLDDVNAPRERQKNNRRVEIHMRRPNEALPPGCLPASHPVDRDTPVQVQLNRGVQAPAAR